jgi:hypothetical protein
METGRVASLMAALDKLPGPKQKLVIKCLADQAKAMLGTADNKETPGPILRSSIVFGPIIQANQAPDEGERYHSFSAYFA